MKRYLLIFALLLSFLANGVGVAGMVCAQPVNTGHAVQMADMGGHAHHTGMENNAHPGGHTCPDCSQSTCDSGHGCANCLAHCAGALIASLPVTSSQSPSTPVFTLKSWHLPSVHSRLLRPPRLS
ncbi:MAG: hypothetical protein KJ914_17815 [Gammaproteobacteria bacterium]|nr:hypothetical protein [Gammaproteobacteria bacterium]MBU1724268.1 hypothetical protein [Gammaproteobacteria bacterium]MBU2006304.1 hypothetical protein [Gammaproteobacteria bacterium]